MKAFEAGASSTAGHNVLLIDTKLKNPNHYIVLGIQRALQQHPRVARVEVAHYDDVVSLARTGQYDLLLAVDGENASVPVLAAARPWIQVMALYCFEDPYEREVTASFASLFDIVFTNDIGSIGAYPRGAIHLPLAASPAFDERPVRMNDADYEFDIAFVGSAWPNRVLVLKRILAALPNLRWKIVLQYNEHLPPASLDLPESSYVGSVSHYDFVEIGNRSRINLSLHRTFSGDGRSARALNPGPRVFELGLAGGFQLIDSHETDVASYYDDRREVDTFTTNDECILKITASLRDAGRRIAMAKAAQERTRTHHLYHHRVDTILAAVSKVTATKQTKPVINKRHRPRLLFVTHNVLAQGNFGGVEVYQETVIREVMNRYDIFFYKPVIPSSRPGSREYCLTNSRGDVLAQYFTSDFDPVLTMTQPEAEQVFSKALSDYRFDLVHFQHLLGHVVSLPLIAKIMGVPTVFTAHDHYSVCTRFNLLDWQLQYCRIASRPVAVCDNCLHQAEQRPRGSQAYRRSFMSRVLLSFDTIAATPSAAAILKGVYPELDDRSNVVHLDIPVPHTRPESRASATDNKDLDAQPALQVVFLGNFSTIKGATILLHAADALRDCNIHFTLCGRIDQSYVDTLAAFNLPNLTVQGIFTPGGVDLTQFDMSLHLSNWPETYCITLSEAWKAGLVPVVTAIGAMNDRVTHGENGFIVPVDGVGELITLLRRLEGNRRELDMMRAGLTPALWQTASQHCEILTALYDRLVGPGAVDPSSGDQLGPFALSALPTLALAKRPINSQVWVNPIEMGGTALANPKRAYNPMRTEIRQVKAALAGGELDPFVTAQTGVEAIEEADHHVPVEAGLRQLTAGAVFRLRGWIDETEDSWSPPVLALRSLNGEVLLRSIEANTDTRHARRRMFVSDPMSADVLEAGVYGVELISLRSRRPHVVGAIGAIFVNGPEVKAGPKATALFSDGGRVPLLVDPWAGISERNTPNLLGRVDVLEVAELDGGYGTSSEPVSMFWRLTMSGWLTEAGGGYSPIGAMLRLIGPTTYYLPLEQVARPDMAGPASGNERALIGYHGTMWIHGMLPGRYKCVIIQRTLSGVVVHPLSEYILHVASDKT